MSPVNSVLKIMFSGFYKITFFSSILSFPLFFACSFIKEDTSDKMDGKTFLILLLKIFMSLGFCIISLFISLISENRLLI